MKRKLKLLRQHKIAQPCGENWDQMTGNDQKRFCAGCGCNVHNISAMHADQAEQLLSQGRACTRIVEDPQRGILTLDGWIARIAVAGAMATAVSGCATGEAAAVTGIIPRSTETRQVMGKMPVPANQVEYPKVTLGDMASPKPPENNTRVGRVAPQKPRVRNKPSQRPTMGIAEEPPAP